jgi:eukaryotic-like serine/threonine-protein kinase
MQQHPRYEVLGLIGNGDFAAVYRARDRELGRDVAIKQIHGQYMNDQRRLERFWREAQLLATLSHPHIMTIYDIVRPRGWLVLELMQGTLLDASKGQPIDLSLLRSALIGSLQALSMLHASHVIHGDIKPSNLMLDRLGRIKLGDFGLARRVANDQGSYLKGATRYMAPELVGPQFGPVGPASDLYSLGFSAYELLCGSQQFEDLFPGLDAFGRDRQIAWMMWHAAADRRLPPVASVLDGVPGDLARVIDRLTTKDQSRRYQTAEQALADLSAAPATAAEPAADDEDAARERRQKFQRRLIAALALCASLLVSTLIAVVPTGKKTAAPATEPVATRGTVRMLIPDRQTLIIEQANAAGPKEVVVHEGDRIYLNDKASLLRELREADQVTIQTLRDDQGRPLLEIQASRPQEDRGTIAALKPDDAELTIALAGADEQLRLAADSQTRIELNGKPAPAGKSFTLADLKPGDRVTAVHFRDQDRDLALKIAATRVVSGEGVVRAIDIKARKVSIAGGSDPSAAVSVWPLDEKVAVTLNGRRLLDNRLLTPADLKPGDQVKFDRDEKIVSIAAQRQFAASGAISAIRYDVKSFTGNSDGRDRTFVLAPQCPVSLGGQEVTFDDLRRGDTFEVQFDDPAAISPAVTRIAAQRPPDRRKWVVMIVGASFDDATVAPLASADAVAKLDQSLTERYAVAPDQIVTLSDPSRIRLEQGLPEALGKASQAGQLLVVIAGRGMVSSKPQPLIAPKDFDRSRADLTGVPLALILAEIDKCAAAEKIVVLDLAPIAAVAQSAAAPPSAAAMVDSVRGTRSRPLLKTTSVIAADAPGSPAEATASPRLVSATAAALAGAADTNRDIRVTLAELNDYLKASGSAPAAIRLIQPDNTPLRLTDDAKAAIRRLAAMVSKQKIERVEAQALTSAAEQLAPKEPEPKLVGAILLLKAREQAEALSVLERLVAERPQTPLAWELTAWVHLEKLNYAGGLNALTQLVRNLPAGKLTDADRRAIPWVGRLREFLATVVAADRRPPASAIAELDAAMQARGDELLPLYEQGRSAVRSVAGEFDKKMLEAGDPNEQLKIKYDRQALRHYASFSLETAAQQAIASLDAD